MTAIEPLEKLTKEEAEWLLAHRKMLPEADQISMLYAQVRSTPLNGTYRRLWNAAIKQWRSSETHPSRITQTIRDNGSSEPGGDPSSD